MTTIDGFHRNFYENERSTDSIQAAIGSARRLVDDLEEMRQKEPQPFTIENESDQRTVTMLTGVEYPLEETREEGFVNIPRPDRPARPRGRRRRRDPGDYRTGGSAARADRTGPQRQRVERGDTGGAGQHLQPGTSGSRRQRVERVRAKQPARPGLQVRGARL